jgi:hypothetical protein
MKDTMNIFKFFFIFGWGSLFTSSFFCATSESPQTALLKKIAADSPFMAAKTAHEFSSNIAEALIDTVRSGTTSPAVLNAERIILQAGLPALSAPSNYKEAFTQKIALFLLVLTGALIITKIDYLKEASPAKGFLSNEELESYYSIKILNAILKQYTQEIGPLAGFFTPGSSQEIRHNAIREVLIKTLQHATLNSMELITPSSFTGRDILPLRSMSEGAFTSKTKELIARICAEHKIRLEDPLPDVAGDSLMGTNIIEILNETTKHFIIFKRIYGSQLSSPQNSALTFFLMELARFLYETTIKLEAP